MGNIRNMKLATFWFPGCRKVTTEIVEGRIPHSPEKAKEFELLCTRCGRKVTVELIRVNGRICSRVYGDDGVGNWC